MRTQVPIGKHAFMPGHLYHTNEITVLLGDNWFAQVTAKKAQDIVSRRQKVVEEKLTDAKRQLNDMQARLAFTTSFQEQEAVEINEEVDDDTYPISKKRIAHTKKTPSVVTATENKAQDDDAELWKRLNELECQEAQETQQETDHWQKQLEEETNAATNHETGAVKDIINISHTALPMVNTTSSNRTHTASAITSPADICINRSLVDSIERVQEQAVKSKSVHWSSDITPSPPETYPTTPAAPKLKPFTSSVIEKSSDPVAPTVSNHSCHC